MRYLVISTFLKRTPNKTRHVSVEQDAIDHPDVLDLPNNLDFRQLGTLGEWLDAQDFNTSRITIDFNEVQPENTLLPMEVTEFGMVIDAKDAQSENAVSPIEVTEFGMVIEVSALQPENVNFPIRSLSLEL